VLIADEPFSGLDSAAGRAAEHLLRDIAAAGSVVVALTHGLVGGADRAYELVGGALTERAAAPTGRLVEIELGPAARLAELAAPTAWPREVVIDRTAGVAVASPEHVATVLRWALDAGLDVIRVDPGGRTS
jgi:energy-coupling factor transporter ATP-binding protein EcfA2